MNTGTGRIGTTNVYGRQNRLRDVARGPVSITPAIPPGGLSPHAVDPPATLARGVGNEELLAIRIAGVLKALDLHPDIWGMPVDCFHH